MRIFTKKIFLATMLMAVYVLGCVGNAYSNVLVTEMMGGVAPSYKGGTAIWKRITEQQSQLVLSAQNADAHILSKGEGYAISKVYANAVGQVFRAASLNLEKGVYASAALASVAPSRNLMKQLPSINAYPNPSRGVTLFALNQTASDNYKIRISNTIGRVVTSAEVPPASATTVVQLDMSSLPSGVYFYSLLVNDKTIETKRLILQK